MAEVVANIKYGTATALTITLASLGTSTTFIAGRESTEVTNTVTEFIDVLLEGFITVGTTPTTAKIIRVYAWGSHTSAATTAKDVIDGLDSAETFTSEAIRDQVCKRVATLNVDSATSNRKYHFGPVSLAQIFGEVPQYWGVFVTHDTVAALNATGSNHEIKYTGIEYTSI